uniref:CSON000713 protein n=1 Tax=Culicoides sonorensis TaxID=179676 RepID=A0A336MFK7_CULSO
MNYFKLLLISSVLIGINGQLFEDSRVIELGNNGTSRLGYTDWIINSLNNTNSDIFWRNGLWQMFKAFKPIANYDKRRPPSFVSFNALDSTMTLDLNLAFPFIRIPVANTSNIVNLAKDLYRRERPLINFDLTAIGMVALVTLISTIFSITLRSFFAPLRRRDDTTNRKSRSASDNFENVFNIFSLLNTALERYGIDTNVCAQRMVCMYVKKAVIERKARRRSASHLSRLVEGLSRSDWAMEYIEGTSFEYAVNLGRSESDCSRIFKQKIFEAIDSTLSKYDIDTTACIQHSICERVKRSLRKITENKSQVTQFDTIIEGLTRTDWIMQYVSGTAIEDAIQTGRLERNCDSVFPTCSYRFNYNNCHHENFNFNGRMFRGINFISDNQRFFQSKREPRLFSFNTDDQDVNIEMELGVPFITIPTKRTIDGLRSFVSDAMDGEMQLPHLNINTLALIGFMIIGFSGIGLMMDEFNRKTYVNGNAPFWFFNRERRSHEESPQHTVNIRKIFEAIDSTLSKYDIDTTACIQHKICERVQKSIKKINQNMPDISHFDNIIEGLTRSDWSMKYVSGTAIEDAIQTARLGKSCDRESLIS